MLPSKILYIVYKRGFSINSSNKDLKSYLKYKYEPNINSYIAQQKFYNLLQKEGQSLFDFADSLIKFKKLIFKKTKSNNFIIIVKDRFIDDINLDKVKKILI